MWYINAEKKPKPQHKYFRVCSLYARKVNQCFFSLPCWSFWGSHLLLAMPVFAGGGWSLDAAVGVIPRQAVVRARLLRRRWGHEDVPERLTLRQAWQRYRGSRVSQATGRLQNSFWRQVYANVI